MPVLIDGYCAGIRRSLQMKFGEWLKAERDRRDWSLQELADTVGFSKQSVHRYEQGRVPNRDVVKQIAVALGVDESEALAAAGFLPEETGQNSSTPTPKGRRIYAWDPVTGNVVMLRPESLRLVDTIIDNELEHGRSERD